MKVKDLKAAEYQARTITDSQLAMLGKSMQNYGDLSGVIFNTRTKRLIGGHQRLKHLDPDWEIIKRQVKDKLGTTAAGFIRTPFGRWIYREVNWPERKEMMASIAANKQGGEFDNLKLKNLVISLDDGKLDTDLLGFDADEMIDLCGLKQGLTDPDAVPALPKKPKTKKGDMYVLGGHRLLCGDATEVKNLKKLINENAINMIYCDPPYNINLDYSKGISATGKYSKTNETKDNKTDADYNLFLNQVIKNALSAIRKNIHIFFWCDERYIWLLQTLFTKNGIVNKRVILWIKNSFSPTPQIAFNKVYEPCIYGTIGKPWLNKKYKSLHEILNDSVGGKNIIENLLSIVNIWIQERDNTVDYQHPTQKPVSLHYKPLKRCTQIDDVVLDLFGGSGSTMVACEQMSRNSMLMELDPSYCDVIVERWENFTGQKARLIKK